MATTDNDIFIGPVFTNVCEKTAKALVAFLLLSSVQAGALVLVNGGQSPFLLAIERCK